MFKRSPLLSPLLLAACVSLAACASMAPKYHRPASPVSDTWPSGPAYAPQQAAAQKAADIPWQQFVKDEKLRKVVQLALDNSRDLRKAIQSITSARAQYRIQRSDLFPQITGSVTETKERTLNTYSTGGASAITFESDSASVGVSSWEIDLFGKQKSLTNAAYESYLSTAEAARATRITLIAETINYYLTLAADRSTLAIARGTLESAKHSMELTQSRLDAGVASAVDVKQAETTYQQARADMASTTASIAEDINVLELTVGAHIDESLLPTELPVDNHWLSEVPAGLSSAVLLDRPDVLEAEHNLKSANADIGAARAKFFPSITLTANDGTGSDSLSRVFKGPSLWTFSPSVSIPIFTGGQNTANLAYYKAQRDTYVSAYESAVQTAFREVADALAVRGTIKEQLDAQQALVDASAASYQLADARYRQGADTFLNALDSQRTLYSAQKTLVSNRLTAAENLVTLYRVLGGGVT